MIVRDREIGDETLTEAQVSEKIHTTATDLATKILAVPEFNAALGRTFFSRGADLHYGVMFSKDGYLYRVQYKAEPLRFHQKYRQNYQASLRLGLLKFDPGMDERCSRLGSLDLYSYFLENENGDVIAYQGGSVSIQDRSDIDHNPQTAFDKIPQVFGVFYQPLKL